VSILSSLRKHFGMIIESADFRALMKNLFAVLWQVRPPP